MKNVFQAVDKTSQDKSRSIQDHLDFLDKNM
nr:MAG TPA: hypothetical protein [Caudoviricetes sp.]